MDKNKWLYIIGSAVALILITVVLVGLIDGVWPWSKGGYFGNYKGDPVQNETEQTTQGTQESDANGNDASQATGEGSGSIDPEADVKIPLDTKENTTGATESTETESTQEATNTPGNEQEISFEDLPKQTEG